MERRRVFSIRTDTVERWTIKGYFHRGVNVCAYCGATAWLTIEQAGNALGLSSIDICRLAGSDRIHSKVEPDGGLVICAASLQALNK